MGRPLAMPPWTSALDYTESGMHSSPLATVVRACEYERYVEAAVRSGQSFNEWANTALIRQAQTWSTRAGPARILPAPKHWLRFKSVWAANDLYTKTARAWGYNRTSRWVRAALNKEVGL